MNLYATLRSRTPYQRRHLISRTQTYIKDKDFVRIVSSIDVDDVQSIREGCRALTVYMKLPFMRPQVMAWLKSCSTWNNGMSDLLWWYDRRRHQTQLRTRIPHCMYREMGGTQVYVSILSIRVSNSTIRPLWNVFYDVCDCDIFCYLSHTALRN